MYQNIPFCRLSGYRRLAYSFEHSSFNQSSNWNLEIQANITNMILQIHIPFLPLTILFIFCQNNDAKWIDMYEEINYKDYGLGYSGDNYSPGWNYSGIIPYYKRIRSAERPQLPLQSRYHRHRGP